MTCIGTTLLWAKWCREEGKACLGEKALGDGRRIKGTFAVFNDPEMKALPKITLPHFDWYLERLLRLSTLKKISQNFSAVIGLEM